MLMKFWCVQRRKKPSWFLPGQERQVMSYDSVITHHTQHNRKWHSIALHHRWTGWSTRFATRLSPNSSCLAKSHSRTCQTLHDKTSDACIGDRCRFRLRIIGWTAYAAGSSQCSRCRDCQLRTFCSRRTTRSPTATPSELCDKVSF